MTEQYLLSQNEILDVRKSFNVSANDIAEYIGSTRQAINNYESGRSNLPKTVQICITLYFQKLANENEFDDYKLSQYQKDILKKVKSFKF